MTTAPDALAQDFVRFAGQEVAVRLTAEKNIPIVEGTGKVGPDAVVKPVPAGPTVAAQANPAAGPGV